MVIERTEDIERRKRTALFAVFVFLCLACLLFFLLKIEYRDPPLVDLHEPLEIEMQVAGGERGGSSSAGNPNETTANPKPAVTPPAQSVLTENNSEDVVPSSTTPSTNTTTSPDPPAQPDPRFAIGGTFGGGDGNSSGTGNGNEEGTGSGQGDSGNGPGVKGFTNGRTVFELEAFEWSTAAGYIDIRIVFYPNGKAKSVSYLKGTINDPALKQKCLEEAMKVKATSITGAKLEFYDYRFTFTEN